jgi:hypothetical protein
LSGAKAVDPIVPQQPIRPAREPEQMQVGNGFTHGKSRLVDIQGAFENDR